MRYLTPCLLLTLLFGTLVVVGAEPWSPCLPEQRELVLRHPSQLPRAPLPEAPPPPTVTDPHAVPVEHLSLDQAICIALNNSEVVRILVGVNAVASGRTIYDPAIANTQIDEARARFDPNAKIDYGYNQFDTPEGILDEADPNGARIVGTRVDDRELVPEISKRMVTGGTASLVYGRNLDGYRGYPGLFPLNPEDYSALEFGVRQPILQGAGIAVNQAPIVLARIDTERSYFQLKDAVQELLRGVIEAYWALVFARTDQWSRQQQVEQAEEAYERAKAQFEVGRVNAAEVAQTQVALAEFRAALIAAKSNVLDREAVLRNIMGLPPAGPTQLVPVTPPNVQEYTFDWEGLIGLAEQYRPDIIELKLILEADEQRLLLAENEALPRVDGVALYRWNGLDGRTPSGAAVSTGGGEYADWTLGVNFSVPLGLRAERARVRRWELLISRDRANLQQGLHQAIHLIAAELRDVARAYEEYEAFKDMRMAARRNLDQQLAEYRAGRIIFLNVLQAITDWGNAVSAEAEALTRYNVALANLERQTGTILEAHGVRFYEERFASIGPLGRLGPYPYYPRALPPGENAGRYPGSNEPSENFFDLTNPAAKEQNGAEEDEEEVEDAPLPPGEQKTAP